MLINLVSSSEPLPKILLTISFCRDISQSLDKDENDRTRRNLIQGKENSCCSLDMTGSSVDILTWVKGDTELGNDRLETDSHLVGTNTELEQSDSDCRRFTNTGGIKFRERSTNILLQVRLKTIKVKLQGPFIGLAIFV
jgi:hypothetical protein